MQAKTAVVQELREKLLKSHWPRCDEIASKLASLGGESAKEALIAGLRARRHHIRTACIRALLSFDDPTLVSEFERLLDDPAYETRVEAEAAVAKMRKGFAD